MRHCLWKTFVLEKRQWCFLHKKVIVLLFLFLFQTVSSIRTFITLLVYYKQTCVLIYPLTRYVTAGVYYGYVARLASVCEYICSPDRLCTEYVQPDV